MATVSCSTGFAAPIVTPFISTIALVFLAMFPRAFAAENKTTQNWIAAWTTANVDLSNPVMRSLSAHDVTEFNNQTYRGIVRTTIGGRAIRIRLANTFGTQPITFAAVFAGLQKNDAALVPGSNHAVTFGG